jgi:hypothetical protein
VYGKLRASRGLNTWKPYACVSISPEKSAFKICNLVATYIHKI